MALTSVAANRETAPCASDRIVDAARVATHIAHEARLLKTVAQDVIEDGLHAAKRSMKAVERRAQELGDLKADALRRVKRHPVLAVGGAFGVGMLVGVVAGWIGLRRRRVDDLPA
jgi:ElaB/YqjD/DUF883 family membrane-anchored ribosome-binding protein